MGSVVVQAVMVGAPHDVSAYVLSGTMGPAEGTDEFVAGMRAAMEAGMADEPLDRARRIQHVRRADAHELRLAEPSTRRKSTSTSPTRCVAIATR